MRNNNMLLIQIVLKYIVIVWYSIVQNTKTQYQSQREVLIIDKASNANYTVVGGVIYVVIACNDQRYTIFKQLRVGKIDTLLLDTNICTYVDEFIEFHDTISSEK